MSLNVVIIDYGLGNIHSAKKSLEQTMAINSISGSVFITSNYKSLETASHIILPGQGSFQYCINGLRSLDGMVDEMSKQIIHKKKPIFGICVGMQLFANQSFENGKHIGLGWIEGNIEKLPNPDVNLPHMGWNNITINKSHQICNGLSNQHFYFVHSYYFKINNTKHILATSNYGIDFPAMITKDNIFGSQFHPEKSSRDGLKLLANFLNI